MGKLRPQTETNYGTPAGLSVQNPLPVIARRAPATTDTGFALGQIWVNKVAGTAYVLTRVLAGAAQWAIASPGTSEVDVLTDGSNVDVSPAGGKIKLANGTNISTVAGANLITIGLNAAITLATSVTSPLYTAGAGVPLAITAPVGQDIVLKMGDAAGANKVSYVTSAGAEVFSINSSGTLGTFAAFTLAGNFAQTAGTFNVGQDNAANAINIGGGTTARAIGIGNSAAAHVLTLGSVTGAAQTIVQSGTVGISINAAGAASPLTLDSVGVLELNSSGAAIAIGNDAVAQNINVGTGAAQRVITVGNITNATAVNINTGTAGSTITTTNGAFSLVTGTGAIGIGTDAAQKVLTIGNVTGTTAVNVNSGSGACAWTTTNGSFGLVTGTGAINLGADAAQKIITIGNSTGTTSVVVNSGTGNLDLGVNATDHTTRVGSTNGVSALTLQSGTGLLSATSGGILTLDSVGVLELNSSGGVISVGNDAVNQNINVGTAGTRTVTIGSVAAASSVVVQSGTGAASFGANATDHTTTVGSTSGVSATVIQSGTGDITVTGTVKELTTEFVTRSGDEITFQASPVLQSALTTGVAPTGVAGDVNLMMLQEGITMEEFIIGTQTIIAPRMDANGLLASLDINATDGVEYNFGAARTNSRHAFTIGTDAAFFFELRFRIATMAGCGPLFFGFRKSAANNANYATYTDFGVIGMNAVTSATEVVISDQLNNGGVTLLNTTTAWAGGNGGTNTLKVLVSAAGVVTYLINGAPPAATHALTFDNGDVVVPFIHLVHTGAGSAVEFVSMKIGYQA